jgi:hypothetical protein
MVRTAPYEEEFGESEEIEAIARRWRRGRPDITDL